MSKFRFVGTTSKEDVDRTMDINPWAPKNLALPYSPITPSSGYFLTLGSGCYSQATISQQGITYVSGIDVLRLNSSKNIDVDHYIAKPIGTDSYAVFMEPPELVSYHHLTLNDSLVQNIDISWRPFVKNVLKGKAEF